MSRRLALIEALSGAPVGPGSALEAAGFTTEGAAQVERRKRRREAEERARDEGSSPSLPEKVMASLGQSYGGPAAMAEPFLRDSSRDPDPMRALRAGNPYGASAEGRGMQREALRGEETPYLTRGVSSTTRYAPGYSPMLTDSGEFSALGAGSNALAALLLAAGVPSGPAPGYAGSVAGSAALPRALPESIREDPYKTAGAQAIFTAGAGAITPNAPPAVDLGDLGTVLRAPGSLVPDLGEGFAADFGQDVVNALPTVGGTSRDVMGMLANERRSRFRRLMQSIKGGPLAGVPDPLGLIPEAIGQ